MAAASATKAPVIIQASRGARAYAGDRVLARLIDGLTEMYPDLDHREICQLLVRAELAGGLDVALAATAQLDKAGVRPAGKH